MPKKTPMRMCVACREMRAKKELVRIVRTPEGNVIVDRTGRANGRGAYLCDDMACLERALKIRAIERALEVSLTPEVTGQLREELHGGKQAE